MASLINEVPPTFPVLRPEDQRLTTADAYTSTRDALGNAIAAQRADASARGLWNDTTGLPTQAGMINAVNQYGGALVAGTRTPKSFTAYHGSTAEPFDQFDLTKVDTGATAGRFASPTKTPAVFLTSNPEHAKEFGPNVQQFNVTGPLVTKNAKADLTAWAKESGYKNAQTMIDDYYNGDIYTALNADQYFSDAVKEAAESGKAGAKVSFGDLTGKVGGKRVAPGDVFVVHDPSAVTAADKSSP